ncbi:hypothetical protein [uncultured Brachyspira sp.]|uniref:hypothetical protein n=1 Tax=uncultured Brachyspira sp. TaxID=221953 RepID=UPI002594A7E0|nr:hypothetical protein [uncultured Brachyspira sp.]
MKKLVLIIFLVGFSRVFAAFEVDVLGQLAASFGLPMAQSVYTGNGTNFYSTQIADGYRLRVKGSTEARLSGSVQIGYQFHKTNSLKGVGVFCNIKIEQFSMGTSTNDGKSFNKREGFNLGIGITSKFIFGSINSLVPRDTIIGFGLGAKVLVAPKIDLGFPPPITPYVDLFVEQRFFVARKLALVGGINVGIDLMIYQFADGEALFGGKYGAFMTFPVYPSLSIGLNIGLHFGN